MGNWCKYPSSQESDTWTHSLFFGTSPKRLDVSPCNARHLIMSTLKRLQLWLIGYQSKAEEAASSLYLLRALLRFAHLFRHTTLFRTAAHSHVGDVVFLVSFAADRRAGRDWRTFWRKCFSFCWSTCGFGVGCMGWCCRVQQSNQPSRVSIPLLDSWNSCEFCVYSHKFY